MSKKNHSPGPVPPGNRPHGGPGAPDEPDTDEAQAGDENADAEFQEQDPKRRLGGYGGTGEHPRQQPGRLNDGDTHSQ
jgi:hypothetical protein